MGDPIGNALALAGLFVLAVIAVQVLLVVLFGVSIFAFIRRRLRRRK
jgi:hypothetical protein